MSPKMHENLRVQHKKRTSDPQIDTIVVNPLRRTASPTLDKSSNCIAVRGASETHSTSIPSTGRKTIQDDETIPLASPPIPQNDGPVVSDLIETPEQLKESKVHSSGIEDSHNSMPPKRGTKRSDTKSKKRASGIVTTPLNTETRRSTRSRAPPKGAAEQLELDAKAKSKRDGGAGKGGRKRKMTKDERWAPENLVTRNSPLVGADLSKLFNCTVISRENLSEEDYDTLCSLLPEEDLIYPTVDPSDISKPDPKPTINPKVLDSVFFKEALRNYQDDLGDGKYEPEYIERAKEARRRRMAGDFDNWKDQNFELQWGDKQRFLDSNAVAGDSAKIKLEVLIAHQQFKIGDVFSMRRRFAGGLMVRKDAELIDVNYKNRTLSFSYPPGEAEWTCSGMENKEVKDVLSLGALETVLIQENGKHKGKIPHGNAFKSIRVLRKGEDIGCVFDIRAKFYWQYLAKDDEQ